MKFSEFLNEERVDEITKIILKPAEKNWRKDYNREGEILLKDNQGNFYRSYHAGKLHHWDDNYYNLFYVPDPKDYYSETKVLNTARFELDLTEAVKDADTYANIIFSTGSAKSRCKMLEAYLEKAYDGFENQGDSVSKFGGDDREMILTPARGNKRVDIEVFDESGETELETYANSIEALDKIIKRCKFDKN